MAYNFFAGATFNYAGTLQLKGEYLNGTQPDYGKWTVSASIYDQTGMVQIAVLSVTNLYNPALPATNGLYQVNAPASQTATWPIGKAQLNLQVITDTGSVQFADPIWLRIQSIPIAQVGN